MFHWILLWQGHLVSSHMCRDRHLAQSGIFMEHIANVSIGFKTTSMHHVRLKQTTRHQGSTASVCMLASEFKGICMLKKKNITEYSLCSTLSLACTAENQTADQFFSHTILRTCITFKNIAPQLGYGCRPQVSCRTMN